MRVISSEIGVERELRRRGWSKAAHALQRSRRKGWFVQEGNEFLVCSCHRLYWYKVEAKDNPWSLYEFKRFLGTLVNLTPRYKEGCTARAIRRSAPSGEAPVRKTRARRSLPWRGK
jgi:hypothetical protein